MTSNKKEALFVLLDIKEFKGICKDDRSWRRVVKKHTTKTGKEVDVDVFVNNTNKASWTDPTCLKMNDGTMTWSELEYTDDSNVQRWVYEATDSNGTAKNKGAVPPPGFLKKATREPFALQLRLSWEGIAVVEIEGDGKPSVASSVLTTLSKNHQSIFAESEFIYVGKKSKFDTFKVNWTDAAKGMGDNHPGGKLRHSDTEADTTYEGLLKSLTA
jgi:hypothetical protein